MSVAVEIYWQLHYNGIDKLHELLKCFDADDDFKWSHILCKTYILTTMIEDRQSVSHKRGISKVYKLLRLLA